MVNTHSGSIVGRILGDRKSKNNEKEAYELGTRAFHEGKSSVPAQNKEVLEMIRGKEIGEGTPILKAYSKGWHQANLRQK